MTELVDIVDSDRELLFGLPGRLTELEVGIAAVGDTPEAEGVVVCSKVVSDVEPFDQVLG